MKTKFLAVPMAIAISFLLTSCDPPLPPEVRTAIMEQTIACESGGVSVYADAALYSLPEYLASTLPESCPDLDISPVDERESADLVITTVPDPQDGKTYIPLVFDASVLATNLAELGSLTLTAESMAKIFDGEITQWDDPELVSENPFEVLPSLPITVIREARPEVIQAFESQMSFLLGFDYSLGFQENAEFDYYQIVDGEEGSLGLLSFVDNFDAYMLTAGFATDGEGGVVIADSLSMASAATQTETQIDNSVITVRVNQSLPVLPLPGSDEVFDPYQALMPVYLGFVPTGNLPAQVAGLYLLRSDVQGDLEQFSVSMLPESLRIELTGIISAGLPEPELTQEQLDQLGLTD